MSGKNEGGKGNPAHTRMANAKKASNRQASWNRRQTAKRVNQIENNERAAKNRVLRAEGKLTPYEEQRAKRRAKRDELRAQDLLPPVGMTRNEWVKGKTHGGKS